MTSPAPKLTSSKWADLGVRAVSSIALIPIVLLDVYKGGVWFGLLTAFVGLMIAYEWSNIAFRQNPRLFSALALTALAGAFCPPAQGLGTALATVVVFALIAAVMAHVEGYRGLWASIGGFYAGLPVLALTSLRGDGVDGAKLIIWILLIVWAMDIFAYFAGRIIGGPKLAPRLSPKKTWAGLAGAIAGAAIVSALFSSYVLGAVSIPLIILGSVLAPLEQAGDMFESAFKRHFDVKDSGNLIPGHGGMMDRVDGLVAVAVAVFCVGYFRNSDNIMAGVFNW
jgi:phosphatidate cytidylyltransferase